jgi:hypothetical protein
MKGSSCREATQSNLCQCIRHASHRHQGENFVACLMPASRIGCNRLVGVIEHLMPKWLKGMVAPTLMLWLFAIAFGVACSVHPKGEMSERASLASRFALQLVIASWVIRGVRGFLTLLLFAAIWLIAMLPVFVVSIVRELAF